MDEFVKTVKPQVLPLSSMDSLLLSIAIQFAFIYENKDGSDDFMPFDVLKESFYKALEKFPIFAGYIRGEVKSNLRVVVDRGNLNMPEYRESTSDVSYAELKAASFSWDKWPKTLKTSILSPLDYKGRIKNVKVQVIRLKDNGGMVISPTISHCLVDGFGYFAFVNLWASICKEMRNGSNAIAETQRPLLFDRGVLKDSLPEARKPLDRDTHWAYTHSNWISNAVARIPQTIFLRLIGILSKMASSKTHMFHLSRESLARMHEAVQKLVPNGTRISDNDLISALVYKMLAQSQRNAQGGKETKDMLVTMACDVRPRLGITDKHYTGNSLVGPRMALESSELCTPTTPESLARIALRVRELVDYIDSKYVGSLLDTLESSPTFHTQSLGTCLKYSDLTITNHTRLEMYNANFGDGVQQWSSSAPWMKANIVFIQPCPPGKTGVNVFIDGSESIMKSVLNNTFWMSVAELVY